MPTLQLKATGSWAQSQGDIAHLHSFAVQFFLGKNNLIIFDPLADPYDLKDFFLMAGE